MQPEVHTPHDRVRGWLSMGIVAGLAFVAGLWMASGPANAQQMPASAVCTAVLQQTSIAPDAAVASWMNEQIAEGRTRFESVPGLTTVLCAW